MVFSVTDACRECLSWDGVREQFACRTAFRALHCCAMLLQDLSAMCASVRRLILIVPATAPARDCHQCFQLVTFGPDVSNCESRGFIDTNPQVHFSRFRHGMVPLLFSVFSGL